MISNENQRQYDVINLSITAHSVLRDRYNLYARILNLSLLASAVMLNAFVFAGDSVLQTFFSISPNAARDGIALMSVIVLIASIVEGRVDWEGCSRIHSDAAHRFSRLKAKYREVYVVQDHSRERELTKEYDSLCADVIHIPDLQFLKLKSAHKFKRILSEEIDKNPGASVFLLKICLQWKAYKKALSSAGGDT